MKKGISLIVLVITIIVIIILSGAVILSLSNNNPITQATTAKNNSDVVTVQSAATLYLARIMAEFKGSVSVANGTSGNLTQSATTLALTDGTNPLYKNGSNAYQAFTTSALATAAGYTTAVVLNGDLMGITLPTGRTWTISTTGTVSGS